MNSSSQSERNDGEDSLGDQIEQEVLKFNKIHRGRHHHKSSRHNHPEGTLYREALKEYMFGKFQIASENCKKMIINNPQNPEPYFLMANMHEEAGKKRKDANEISKAVEFYFLHAYYSSPSIQKWLKVADLSFQLEIYFQAAYCYGRALKINNNNLQILLKRAQALQKCGETKKSINIYKRILQKISGSMEVYKRYAKLRFKRQQYSKAREILESYEGFQGDINIKYMICETYLREKKYFELQNFMKKSLLTIEEQQQSLKMQEQDIQNSELDEQADSRQKPQNKQTKQKLVNFEDLQIQFVQMLYICKIMNQHSGQQSHNILTLELENIYQQYYCPKNLQKYLLNFYQQKYRKRQNILEKSKTFTGEEVQQIQQYEQLPEIYEQILNQMSSLGTHSNIVNLKYQFLNNLIAYPAHQTIKNYLLISEHLKNQQQFQAALKILKQALSGSCSDAVQIKIEANNIRSLLNQQREKQGIQKKNRNLKAKNKNKSQPTKRFQQTNNNQKQDIFYSDDDDNDGNLKEQEQESFLMFKDEDQQSNFLVNSNEINKSQKKLNKTRKPIHKNPKKPQSLADPSLTQKLLKDTKIVLENIVISLQSMKYFQLPTQQLKPIIQEQEKQIKINEQKQQLLKEQERKFRQFYLQIKQCLSYLSQVENIPDYNKNPTNINNTRINNVEKPWQQKTGIYAKNNNRRRRYQDQSRKKDRGGFMKLNAHVIIDSIKYIITFMKKCIIVQKYQFVNTLAQMFSKSRFFTWQNRITQFRYLKCQIYEMGAFVCIELSKFHKALFFCRYLINRFPENQFYLGLLSYVLEINQKKGQKVSLNSIINKGIEGIIQEQQQIPPKGEQIQQKKIIVPIKNKLDNTKKQQKFIKLEYLFAIEYMDNGFFQLAIRMFLRVLKNIQNHEANKQQLSCLQINTYLSITTCFLQMASSRTVFNKLDYINRSAFCFKKYCTLLQNSNPQKIQRGFKEVEMLFNLGRWHIFVKLYSKAIDYFSQVLSMIQNYKNQWNQLISQKQSQQLLKIEKQAAYNLIIIYKDIQQLEEAKILSTKYFLI